MGLFSCSVNVKLEQDRGRYLFQVEFGNNKTYNKKKKIQESLSVEKNCHSCRWKGHLIGRAEDTMTISFSFCCSC